MNKVILLGRLTRDIELRYTQSAEPVAVANFSLAVDRPYTSKREGAQDVDFINCVCYRQRAEAMSKFLRKGNRVAVCGRIETRSWTDKEGQKRYSTEVVVDEFDFCESKASGEYSQQQPMMGGQGGYGNRTQGNTTPDGFFFTDGSSNDADLPFE